MSPGAAHTYNNNDNDNNNVTKGGVSQSLSSHRQEGRGLMLVCEAQVLRDSAHCQTGSLVNVGTIRWTDHRMDVATFATPGGIRLVSWNTPYHLPYTGLHQKSALTIRAGYSKTSIRCPPVVLCMGACP
jgi:hypothetical protein